MTKTEQIIFYLDKYPITISLSLLYFAALAFLGLFLIIRRASLFGFVLTYVSKLSLILGFGIYSLFGYDAYSMINVHHAKNLNNELFRLDMIVFPLILLLMSALILVTNQLSKSKKFQNIETFYVLVIAFSVGMTLLAFRFLGADSLMISRFYFTEILYTPQSLFIRYLYFLLPAVIIFLFFFKRMLLAGFDKTQAHILKLNAQLYDFIFYLLTGFIIAICTRILGIYLTLTVLLAPGYISLFISRSLSAAIILTISLTLIFGIIGFFMSFLFDHLPAEATLITVFCGFSLLVSVVLLVRKR